MNIQTKAVHTGVNKDSEFNSVITPIYPTSTFKFDKLGSNRGYDYTRSGNPTRAATEENIAALEGGHSAFCTSTGMSAIAAILHLLKNGDHIIAGNDIYSGTYRLMTSLFQRIGLDFSFVDMRDPDNVTNVIRKNTAMIWIETPSNPLLNIIDINYIFPCDI